MPMIIEPRNGDAEDDASSTKKHSLIAIAGSLLGEISLPKLALAWLLGALLPSLLLGAAPLVATEQQASPVLRDEDGGESHAPAFLKAPRAPRAPKAEAPAAAEGEEKPKARRRRAPRSFEGGEASSNETEEA